MARPPLPPRVVPDATRMIAAVVAGPWVIAAAARVDLPLPGSPVPVSLQTLAVALAGLLLGPGVGTTAVLVYLALGAAGLPVLADGAGGLAAMVGPSIGYLAGFPLCAWVAGRLRGQDRRGGAWWDLAGALVGQAIVLVLGVVGLVVRAGMAPTAAVTAGALPFLPGMLGKAVLAAAIATGWRRSRAR